MKSFVLLLLTICLLVFSLFQPGSAADFIIQSIAIVSNTKTYSDIIRQEIDLKTNCVLSEREFLTELSNNRQSVMNLGFFGDVDWTIKTNQTNVTNLLPVDLTIAVIDKWTLFPIPYYFYNNEAGSVFGFLLNELNLFGLNMNLNLKVEYQTGPDQYKIAFTYTYPKVLGSIFLIGLKFTYLDFWDSDYADTVQTYKSRYTSLSSELKVTAKLVNGSAPLSVGIKMNIDFVTNKVVFNYAGIQPGQRLSTYLSAGVEQGLVNLDRGKKWGDDNHLWIGISPLDGSWMFDLQHAKYFIVFNRDVLAYKFCAMITPNLDQPLDISLLRGIRLGDVRGNAIFYGNFSYRKFICTIPWPTPLEFFIPAFLDLGNGIVKGESFSFTNTMITVGIGLRFYPRFLGGKGSVLRIDTGINLTHLAEGLPFSNFFYIGFDFSDVF